MGAREVGEDAGAEPTGGGVSAPRCWRQGGGLGATRSSSRGVAPPNPRPHPSLTTKRTTKRSPAQKTSHRGGRPRAVSFSQDLWAERPPPGTCWESGRKTPGQAATHRRSETPIFSMRGSGIVRTGSRGTSPTRGPSSTSTLQPWAQP